MKALVTGGAGFIGSHVVDLLLDKGYETVVIDNLATGNRDFVPPGAHFIQADITSPTIEDIFDREKPDVVIHLAAQVNVEYSIQNPEKDADCNILGTIRLLNCCRKSNVQKFIFSSSCAVYGETADCSIAESFPIQPLSFYGISKYTSEMYIKLFHQLYGLPYTILRYANVYGPRQSIKGEGGVIALFTQKIIKGESPFIFGDGEQTRDFVYVKDVVAANVLSIQEGTNEILNIGCNHKTSINQLYHMMTSIDSKENLPLPIYLPKRDGDIPNSRLNHAKAVKNLGWHPSYDLHTGLIETLNYYQAILD